MEHDFLVTVVSAEDFREQRNIKKKKKSDPLCLLISGLGPFQTSCYCTAELN